MSNSYTQEIDDKLVTFTYLGAVDVPFEHVTSVAAIPFTANGRLVAVRLRKRGLDLPGGHVETHETSVEQTLRREVIEEACMTIQSPVLVETIQSDYFGTPSYMQLYAVLIDELHDFVPSDEASERVIISPEEYITQYTAGNRALMWQAITKAQYLLQLPHTI